MTFKPKAVALILIAASLSLGSAVNATTAAGGSVKVGGKNGAIAYSAATQRYGIAVDATTPVKAQAVAIKACGESDCTVKFTFLQCGAIAANSKKIGFGKSATRRDAEIQALAAAGSSSKVLVSGCNKN
jgi:hypothetical protein